MNLGATVLRAACRGTPSAVVGLRLGARGIASAPQASTKATSLASSARPPPAAGGATSINAAALGAASSSAGPQEMLTAEPTRNVKRVSKLGKQFSVDFVDDHTVKVVGPLGEQTVNLPTALQRLPSQPGLLNYFVASPEMPRLVQTLIANAVHGVCFGYHVELRLNGVGFKTFRMGEYLGFDLGFAHLIFMEVPPNLVLRVRKTRILISGINKQQVTQFAAEIRALKPPDAYKGKGIRYADEEVVLKSTKKGSAK